LSFASLDEAQSSETVCLIPSKFTMTNENFEEVEVVTGSDSNEDQNVGQSVTQMPKTYVFQHGNIHVRIIDTPGIGDTRGIDQDRKNMENIMTHLANLDEINGIVVLLKPNNARLTVMFSFCIKELLTHLHRDACRNIVFCFTNARSTFYRPGDTMPALRELLAKSRDVDIKLTKETIFCIDNESVRFLAALKQGIKFDEEQTKQYAVSWETSVKETERLVDYVSSLTPHKVKNTLSLNDARRLVIALSRPIAEIGANIHDNISVVEQKKKEIADAVERKEKLTKDRLKVKVVYLETEELGHPRTVCTDSSCVEYVSTGVGDIKETNYVTHCHEHCFLTGTQINTVNCTALQHCAAMTGPNNRCGKCGHSWSVHMHITYEITKKDREEEDLEVQKLITSESTYIEGVEKMQKNLDERIEKLKDEERTVTEVSARFACFLKLNAIAPYNDALGDYLDHLINDEKGKVGVGGEKATLERLQNTKAMYEKEVKVLEESFKRSDVKPATAADIKILYAEKLCKLEFSGPNLKDIMNVSEAANAAAATYSETRIDLSRSHGEHSTKNKGYVGRLFSWLRK